MPKIEFHCPKCGSQIQVDKKSVGLTAPCPRCREWIRVPDEPAEPPPEKSPAMKLKEPVEESPAPSPGAVHYGEPSPAPHHGAALGGWSCLLISLVLMFLQWDLWFVFAPLLVVALILGVVAMARGHILSGQTLLVATLLLPVLVAVKFHNKDIDALWIRARNSVATAEKAVAPGPEPTARPAKEPVVAALPVESDWGEAVDEPVPDWESRYDYWFEQYSNRFVQPRVGLYVKVQLKEGQSYEGTLRDVDAEAMTLQIPNGQMRLEKTRLTEETRRRFFQSDFAKFHARRKVNEEREAYDAG
jgi:hypothetical protein